MTTVEHYQLKPGTLGSISGDCKLFTFAKHQAGGISLLAEEQTVVVKRCCYLKELQCKSIYICCFTEHVNFHVSATKM